MKVEVDLDYCYYDPDRHGNDRWYVWLGKGHKKHRIREEPNTKAFLKAYDAAVDLSQKAAPAGPQFISPAGNKILPNTYRWLCTRYLSECSEFLQNGARTRHVRKLVLDSTYDEPIEQGSKDTFANFPLHRLTIKAIRVLRDRKAEFPEAGNSRIKALRQVFAWAIKKDIGGIEHNPAAAVPYFGNDGEGFHTWTIEEVEQFEARHPIGTKARMALGLLLFVGVRRSDAVLLGRQMIRNGWIYFTETKGRKRKVKERAIPAIAPLRAIIEQTPSEHMTFLVTEFGAPFSAPGFGNWFRKRCDEAGLPQCSAHGLRKAGATIAADNGATPHQLMAMYGWETLKQAEVYTRKANRKKLAGDAMHLVDPIRSGTESFPPDAESLSHSKKT